MRTPVRCVLKTVLATAALAIGAQNAAAAALPVKARPVAVAAFNWSGCYIGANAGWIGSRNSYNLGPSGTYFVAPGGAAPPNAAGTGDFPADIAALNSSYSANASGALIGGQIGCNRQMNRLVFGIEADLDWSSLNTSITAGYAAFANLGNPAFTNAARVEQVSSKLQALATLRGRVGYAFDRWLVYGTGGVALGRIQADTNVSFGVVAVNPVYNGAIHIGSTTLTRFGWVLGAGAEYALTGNWSLKGEYLYVNLGSYSYNSPLVAATAPAAVGPGYSWSTTASEREHIVRLGLNYKLR